MAANPRISIATETLRHLGAGELSDVTDTLRHEGLKKGIEASLYLASRNRLGRAALDGAAGEPVCDTRLHTSVSTLDLEGPVGLAPGWDKTGKTLQAWQVLGARHLTVGGITYFAQAGNPMPRLRTFDRRVGDHGTGVTLNSFGFWNPGVERVTYNIQRQRELGTLALPVIAQITLNKEFYQPANRHMVHDLVRMSIEKILPVVDAINLGLSSPNTPGMRDAQDADDFMSRIMAAAREATQEADKHIPIILKGDGDGGEARLEKYCKLAESRKEYFDAFELINTTQLPNIKERYGAEDLPGGIAGADQQYQELALQATKFIYEAVGDRLDIIATGGIDSPEQALKAIEAGASAVGINSAVRKLGLGVMRSIERGLLPLLDKQHPAAASLDQVIGNSTSRGPKHLSREKVSDRQ